MRNKITVLMIPVLIFVFMIPFAYSQGYISKVAPPIGISTECGNFICEIGEDESNCPNDCLRCFETDQGMDYYTAGSVKGIDNLHIYRERLDYCYNVIDENIPRQTGSHLAEFYCADNIVSISKRYCENGCQHGFCIPECIDSDTGLIYFEKGFISGINSQGEYLEVEDSCYDGSNKIDIGPQLVEYECSIGGHVSERIVDCEFGCQYGYCLKEESICNMFNIYWANSTDHITSSSSGDLLNMVVETTHGCNGKLADFKIWEKDLFFDDLTLSTSMVVTEGEIKFGYHLFRGFITSKYYFEAEIDGQTITSSILPVTY